MGSSILPGLRTAGIGAWPGAEQVAHARRTASRQERRGPATCRRLHQFDLEAPSGASRKDARRIGGKRCRGCEPAQPVLARTAAFHLFEYWHADAPATA